MFALPDVIRQIQPPQAPNVNRAEDDIELQRPAPAHIRDTHNNSPELIGMDEFLRGPDAPYHHPLAEQDEEELPPRYDQINQPTDSVQPPGYDQANPPPDYRYGWQGFKKSIKDHPAAAIFGTVSLTLLGTLLGFSIKNAGHQQTR